MFDGPTHAIDLWTRRIAAGDLNLKRISDKMLPAKDPLLDLLGFGENGKSEAWQFITDEKFDIGSSEKRFSTGYFHHLNIRGTVEFPDEEGAFVIPRYRKQITETCGPETLRTTAGFFYINSTTNRANIYLDGGDEELITGYMVDSTEALGVGKTLGGSAYDHTVAVGYGACYGIDQDYMTGVGRRALYECSGGGCTGVGRNAGMSSSGTSFTGIGRSAGVSNTGDDIVCAGLSAAESNTGNEIVAIGRSAGYEQAGDYGTFLGYRAGWRQVCEDVVAVGHQAGYQQGIDNAVSPDNATLVGVGCGFRNQGKDIASFGKNSAYQNVGDDLSAFGRSAAYQNSGDKNTALGRLTFNTFVKNVGGAKTFAHGDVDPETDYITIAGHSFGAVGAFVHLHFAVGLSELPGLDDDTVYQCQVIDANTIWSSENITAAGTGTGHTYTPRTTYTNSIALGYHAEPDASNQCMIGDANLTEIKSAAAINVADGTINGDLTVTDGVVFALSTVKTGAYNVAVSDRIVQGDASGGNFTITLPSGAATGQMFRISNVAASGTITVDAAGGENISGAASKSLAAYETIGVWFDGSDYQI